MRQLALGPPLATLPTSARCPFCVDWPEPRGIVGVNCGHVLVNGTLSPRGYLGSTFTLEIGERARAYERSENDDRSSRLRRANVAARAKSRLR